MVKNARERILLFFELIFSSRTVMLTLRCMPVRLSLVCLFTESIILIKFMGADDHVGTFTSVVGSLSTLCS